MNQVFELHFEIEETCPFKCKHCSSYHESTNRIGYSLDNMRSLIKVIPYPVEIYLTGGEPLCCDQLNEILHEINQIRDDSRIGLFTTGATKNGDSVAPISLDQSVALSKIGLKFCYLSLYSNVASIHDSITNYSGSHLITKKAINNLIHAGIEVKLNVVVMHNNVDSLYEIIEEAKKLGVAEIRFLKLINHGNAKNNWHNIGISSRQFNSKILDILKTNDNQLLPITVAGCPQITACRPYKTASLCQAGTNLLYVDYQGYVSPCACVKNDIKYRLFHISDYTKILDYFKTKRAQPNNSCLSGGITDE